MRGGNRDLELAIRLAHQLLAGEAVAIDRVWDQMAVAVIDRQGEEPRLRGRAAHHHVAASIERAVEVVCPGDESEAIAKPHRQDAVTRDRGARVRIDLGTASLGIGGPRADRHGAEGDISGQRKPGHAKPDRRRHNQGQQGAE